MERKEKINRQKEFLISVAFWVVCFLLAGLFLKAAGSVLLPFVIAFLIAWLLSVPVDWIVKKFHWRRSFVSVAVVLLFYALIGILIYFVGSRIVRLVYDTLNDVMLFISETVMPVLQKFFSWLENLTSTFLPTVEEAGNTYAGTRSRLETVEKAGEMASKVTGSLLGSISGAAAGIPGFFMKVLIAVIATIFMELEFHSMMVFLQKQIPEDYQKALEDGKKYVTGTLGKCLLSYCLILAVTFAELCVGLLILGVDGAVVIAFMIAILDILPILGTGAVLVPWAVIAMSSGNLKMGLGIFALYILITVVRNIIEPKLVGRQMGLSPVVMLPCMLIGLRLFGIIGLFAVPLGVAFIKSLNDRGVIHVFKT